ncbi:MAG: serine/threonine protein kinase [Candidatus Obscuribacterales bacterium]|nr:serine/threonine protein kinase [Candidatus Obscuribacterales bacterium]
MVRKSDKLQLKHINLAKCQVISHVHGESDFTEQSNIETTLALGSGVLLMVVCVLATFGQGSYLMRELTSELGSLFYLLVFAAIALVAGSLIHTNRIYERSQLKILEVTDRGIKLGRERFGDGRHYFIPWSKLVTLEAVRASGRDAKSGAENLLFLALDDGTVFRLNWKNAFAWVEEESFVSRVRSEVPGTQLNWNIGKIELSRQDERYTNLWLQYFTVPDKRKRRTGLEAGIILQDGLYEIVYRLGGGGQGTAYIAEVKDASSLPYGQVADHALVVLKEYVLPVYRGTDLETEKYALLNQEKDLLSRIDHPQIVKLLDCFVEDHRGYLVQEYIEGETLRDKVKNYGAFDPPQAASLAASICDILSYLHCMKPPVVHRDITPENLIYRSDGLLKLVDFTVAHQFEARNIANVVGKQAYMPAEQFRGEPCPQSDIYAMGATLYFLLTGSDPEPMTPSNPSELIDGIDESLNRIVAKATAFDTNKRYRTALDARADLKLFLQNLSMEVT